MVQRSFNYAIVDEVDSILIDEARTPSSYPARPRTIPSSTGRSTSTFRASARGFEKDEKQRAVTLTEAGVEKMESMLKEAGVLATGGLYDLVNINHVHHVNQALRAHKLFTRDVDYIVKDDKIIIIDEFTGRMMEGRRYSEGLHQALEAKENVTIQNENQTLASITFQNYFRLFPKLAGMTGTAMTEASEFMDIYKLEVIEIPTNMPVRRADGDDEVYRTRKEKHDALLEAVTAAYEKQQPVLLGTISIERSEELAALFKKAKLPHQVLNARYHEQEALIIAQAGKPGAVTIATNMAGRGTDIQLGGNFDMRMRQDAAHLTTDRARAEGRGDPRRDRGRARHRRQGGRALRHRLGAAREPPHRQSAARPLGSPGRPGRLEILRLARRRSHAHLRLAAHGWMLTKLGLKEGEAIIHPWINKALEKAQQKVEARNFEIRKHLLKYDDVMNDQRKVVYAQRKEIMSAKDVQQTITDMRHETVENVVLRSIPRTRSPTTGT